MLLTAIFASEKGLIYGQTSLLYAHLISIVIITLFTLSMSYFLFKVVDFITPIRVREDQEERGLDASQHGELFS